jgi:hypothetical protein
MNAPLTAAEALTRYAALAEAYGRMLFLAADADPEPEALAALQTEIAQLALGLDVLPPTPEDARRLLAAASEVVRLAHAAGTALTERRDALTAGQAKGQRQGQALAQYQREELLRTTARYVDRQG